MAETSFDWAKRTVSERIKHLRLAQGLTQERLAFDCEIDRTFISQIERGVGNPSLKTLCRIADRFAIPVWVLVGANPETAPISSGS